MRLTVFNYGTTELAEDQVFFGGSRAIRRPIALLFFLIETQKRKILVDTGCDTMPGFCLRSHRRPVEILADYGLVPADITDIVLTHAHHDHSDCLRYYPAARLYLHRDETLQFNHPGECVRFDSDTVIAPGVIVRHVGGHTRGSSIVLVEAMEKTWVLCGDECYDRENLEKKLPSGVSVSLSKSLEFVNTYGDERYIPLVFHDLGLLDHIGYRVLMATET